MEKLKEIGIKLYIGNYTSGYLDLRASYSESFQGMVLNVRNIIEDSCQENAEILISTRANMLAQLGKDVIFARVENLEQYNLVKDLQGKCFCGRFFSSPMSKNELQNKFWHGDRVEVQDGIVKHFEEDIVP
jgi:EAL domain-containing protein (putative c-di-GMP-specific phosphodiesterase class I)